MQCSLKNIYPFILIQILILLYSFEVFASIQVLDKGLISLQKDSAGLQFYIDIENKDRLSSCSIHSWTENCCLDDGADCNTMVVYGGDYFAKPKDRETIIFVYPSIFQHDLFGYCDFVLDYQCGRKRRSKRQKVYVLFDTRVNTEGKPPNALLDHYLEGKTTTCCDTLDLDSLHDCEPVNCDMKYSGERSYFDNDAGKCVEAPICESNPDNELPDIVYVPSINTCRDLEHPLTVGDIYAISTGMGVVTEPHKSEEVKVEVISNCSTISQNLKLMRDMMYGKLCPVLKGDVSEYSQCFKSAVMSILMCIGGVCALLFSFFCCIQTMTWLHKKFTEGEFQNFMENFKNMFKSPKESRNYPAANVNSDVRNTLLREVIVKDIPIELRDSIVNICERMEKKVKRKKRYRSKDIGSQISLNKVQYDVRVSTTTSSTSSLEECDEKHKLLK